MNNYILSDISLMLGGSAEDNPFETQILIAINTAIQSLIQIGVITDNGFVVFNNTSWDQIPISINDFSKIKEYVYLKTLLLFAPPSNSFLITNYENLIRECEWRMYVEGNHE